MPGQPGENLFDFCFVTIHQRNLSVEAELSCKRAAFCPFCWPWRSCRVALPKNHVYILQDNKNTSDGWTSEKDSPITAAPGYFGISSRILSSGKIENLGFVKFGKCWRWKYANEDGPVFLVISWAAWQEDVEEEDERADPSFDDGETIEGHLMAKRLSPSYSSIAAL